MLSAAGTAAIVNLQPCDADVSGAGLAPTKEAEHKRDAVKLDVSLPTVCSFFVWLDRVSQKF